MVGMGMTSETEARLWHATRLTVAGVLPAGEPATAIRMTHAAGAVPERARPFGTDPRRRWGNAAAVCDLRWSNEAPCVGERVTAIRAVTRGMPVPKGLQSRRFRPWDMKIARCRSNDAFCSTEFLRGHCGLSRARCEAMAHPPAFRPASTRLG